TDSEPGRVFWGADEELSDGGSPRVIVYEYDGLPMLPVAPPSPDYIPGPEEPQTPPAPQDEEEPDMFSASSAVTYTSVYTDSKPGRVFWGAYEELSDGGSPWVIVYRYDGLPMLPPHDLDFVPEPIYLEYIPLEDEHILLVEEQALPPVISPTTESLGITIQPQTSISLPPEADVERLLAMPIPSPSPLTSLSPPSAGERLARCTAPATLQSPPLPPFSYPPPPVDRSKGVPESEQPPRKRLCLSTLGFREVGYGIRDTWIDLAEEDDSLGDSMDRKGRGLCCPRSLGSIGSVKPDSTSCALDPPRGSPEAYAMIWEVLKKKMTDKYYPQERADNKRKTENTSRNNHGHQQRPFKKQNVAKVYNIGTGERKPYEGSLPKCSKCQRHHNGLCNKVGYFACDCKSSGNANVANAQRGGKEIPKGNGCFECRASGHFKRDCPKLLK
nr:hypothetical protein [Tanacetum cinerariifolium]